MADINIKKNIEEKFSQPLNEFYKRRIVFWKDSDKEFESFVDEMNIENVNIVKLRENNSFLIKKQMLIDDPESDFLVYDTTSFDDPKDNWMWDIELYSEVFRADFLSTLMEEMNIADHPSLRNMVKEYSVFFENKDRKKAYSNLCLVTDDLKTLHLGIIASLCRSKSLYMHEILLNLMKDHGLLDDIKKFGNEDVFWKAVSSYTGYKGRGLNELLQSILITALGQNMDPDEIEKHYPSFFHRENIVNCYDIVNEWFNSSDVSFVKKMILDCGRDINVISLFQKLSIPQVAGSDIFPHANGDLVVKLLKEINNNIIRTNENINLIEKRRSMRWYEDYRDYFEGIYYITKMQEIYQKYQNVFHMITAADVWKQYANHLYLFDTYYRKFHCFFQNSLKHTNVHVEDDFKKCAEYIENLYTNWFLKNLTANWISVIEDDMKDNGKVSLIKHQNEFYYQNVENNKNKKITFVIISDALRYEVGKELFDELNTNARANVTIEAYQSAFPSVTEFGMACLLPGHPSIREDGMIMVSGIESNSTEKRQEILKSRDADSVAIVYDDFLSMLQSERNELIKGKKVVYIYHNDIDARGDKLISENQVFDACEDTIGKLNNLVQVLVHLRGSCHIVITADHGFLYNYKPLNETNKISKTELQGIFKAGRRYIVGTKDTNSAYMMAVKMLVNDKESTYCGLAPRDIVRIKLSGGGENYVHGGVSLQEMMIPVISYDNVREDSKEYQKNMDKYSNTYAKIQLVGENRKVSNSIFTLNFYQSTQVGGNVLPGHYEIYMADHTGKPVSDVKSVVADKKDKDSSDRQFKVRMNMKPIQFEKQSSTI